MSGARGHYEAKMGCNWTLTDVGKLPSKKRRPPVTDVCAQVFPFLSLLRLNVDVPTRLSRREYGSVITQEAS